MADNEKSVLESLNELGDLDGGGEAKVAKVKARKKVKEQRWMSDDSAEGLLAGLIGETEADAEDERSRRESERKRREDEERMAREREEDAKRRETEERIAAERSRVQQQEQRRTQMLAAIERKRKEDSGEAAEEERRRQEVLEAQQQQEYERKRQLKEAELSQAQILIQEQQAKLHELVSRPAEYIPPPKSNTGLIVGIVAAVFVLGGGGLAAWFLTQPDAEMVDPYAIEGDFPSAQLATAIPESAMTEVGLDVVSQSADQQVMTIAAGGGEAASDSTGRRDRSRRRSDRARRRAKSEFDNLGGGKGGGVLGGGRGKIVF